MSKIRGKHHQAHYVRFGTSRTFLFGDNKRLPKWFSEYDWKTKIYYSSAKLFKEKGTLGLKGYREGLITVLISDQVRAILEALSLVPNGMGIEESKELMGSLVAAHPEHVTELLKSCTSIKAKRLFLALADFSNHAWLERLNLKDVDLGSGPRILSGGGKLHKKYQINLPESFYSQAEG